MIKNKIELIRDGQPRVLLEWHRHDACGNTTPIAIDFTADVDEDMRQRITDICARPINVRENGAVKRAQPGSSAHFIGLPPVLARLGFRTRVF